VQGTNSQNTSKHGHKVFTKSSDRNHREGFADGRTLLETENFRSEQCKLAGLVGQWSLGLENKRHLKSPTSNKCVIRWMEEILHQLIGGLSQYLWGLSQYLWGYNHPRCCRISSIHSIMKGSHQWWSKNKQKQVYEPACYMEVSWNGGTPKSSIYSRIFHYKPTSYWGSPMAMETPMYWYLNSWCQIFYSSHLVGGIRTAATTLCFFPILWNTSALAQCHGDTPSIAFPRYIHWWLRVPLTANEWSPCELQAQKR